MAGSRKDVRLRLQRAALELYAKRGFDLTMAAEIAALAGVTERACFRHSPDKRDVLFDGEAEMRTALVDAVSSAPAGLPPLPTLLEAFLSVVPMFERDRAVKELRHRIISSTPELQERELMKLARLTVPSRKRSNNAQSLRASPRWPLPAVQRCSLACGFSGSQDLRATTQLFDRRLHGTPVARHHPRRKSQPSVSYLGCPTASCLMVVRECLEGLLSFGLIDLATTPGAGSPAAVKVHPLVAGVTRHQAGDALASSAEVAVSLLAAAMDGFGEMIRRRRVTGSRWFRTGGRCMPATSRCLLVPPLNWPLLL